MRGSTLGRDEVEVTLVGAGRSGSQIALVAAMLGFPLRIYDPDRLGPENQGLQFYRRVDVARRRPKVRALGSLVRAIVPTAVLRIHPERFTGVDLRSPVVVVAVDSLHERRALWNGLRESRGLLLLLDARIGPGVVRLHALQPGRAPERSDYEASLAGDEPAGPPACGQDDSAHAAAAAAALVGGALCAFVDRRARPPWVALDLDRAQWCAGRAREPDFSGSPRFSVRPGV
jgi:hypothetical protein